MADVNEFLERSQFYNFLQNRYCISNRVKTLFGNKSVLMFHLDITSHVNIIEIIDFIQLIKRFSCLCAIPNPLRVLCVVTEALVMPTHLEQGRPVIDMWDDLIIQNVSIYFSQHSCSVVDGFIVVFCFVVPEGKWYHY